MSGSQAGPGRVAALRARLRARRADARRRAAFRASVTHVSGALPDLARRPEAVVVVAMVRDGSYHLADFLAHYRAMGVAHFIFCDNGSTDGTLEALRDEPDCAVLQSLLPFAQIENLFRAHAATEHCAYGWVLFADLDERFRYPGMERAPITALTRYMLARGQTALVAQMAEMFPEGPLAPWQDRPVAEVMRAYRFFDADGITRLPYHDRDRIDFWYLLKDNRLTFDEIGVWFGGVRAKVFGEACCLTKHPLVQVRPPVLPGVHPHCASHVVVSDVMGTILHYKFTDRAFDRDAASVAQGGVGHGEDVLRAARAKDDPEVTLWSETATALEDEDALLRTGFMRASAAYLDELEARPRAPAIDAVVIGRNEGDRLRACLESLRDRVRGIVYVDSGSTDGSPGMARAMGARVVDLDMAQPFTAARARNAGLAALPPDADLVQLIDGDCILDPGWLDRATDFLARNPHVGLVCGRRAERFPEASLYNRLADIEWNTPVGEARACGGDALARIEALRQVGGFRDDLIAGEEPEMCLRLRRAGWTIWRLDAAMTAHDAAMTRLSQWWRRSLRAGHAFAEGAALHGGPPDHHWQAETRRALVWGLALPLGILAAGLIWPPAWLGGLIYPAQVLRLAPRHGLAWAAMTTLAKFAEAQGVLRYWSGRIARRRARIIEYK